MLAFGQVAFEDWHEFRLVEESAGQTIQQRSG
jgi:hypothetical protein